MWLYLYMQDKPDMLMIKCLSNVLIVRKSCFSYFYYDLIICFIITIISTINEECTKTSQRHFSFNKAICIMTGLFETSIFLLLVLI